MKPNHICKYSGCTLGKDGSRKKYYACGYCDATENWKSMACCKEHYSLYMQEVLAARDRNETVDTLPDRIDMTREDVKNLKKKTLKQVKKETEDELREYADESGKVDITAAVAKINAEIDKNEK